MRALFLDRDGVINVDRGYVFRIDQFDFMPGIFDLARTAVHELGFALVVATNQSGIGRGYYDEAAYEALTRWMCDRFAAERAPVARVYHCPYHPTEGVGPYRRDHPWRKPQPGMILQAAADLGLDLPASALLGDKAIDIEAGAAAGVGLLVRLDPALRPLPVAPAHETVADLAAAGSLLRERFPGPGRGNR